MRAMRRVVLMPAARPSQSAIAKILASEATAARLLDMQLGTFRSLVKSGALPPPIRLDAETERWRVRDLEAIVSGDASERPLEW